MIQDILQTLQDATSSRNPHLIELSYSTAIGWLTDTTDIEAFLQQYVTPYISTGSNWKPVKINKKEELKNVFATSRVFTTLKANRQDSSVSGNSADIEALSFCSIVRAGIGGRVDCYYYGDVTHLCDHVTSQLLHIATVWDSSVGLLVHFLTHLEFDQVEHDLSELGLTRDKVVLLFDRLETVLAVRPFLSI